jgi:hypothetical protein
MPSKSKRRALPGGPLDFKVPLLTCTGFKSPGLLGTVTFLVLELSCLVSPREKVRQPQWRRDPNFPRARKLANCGPSNSHQRSIIAASVLTHAPP